MDRLTIEGGHPLFGQVTASGAKNAALPIMAASLLVNGPVRLSRVPRLGDVATMAALVARLGAEVEWTGDNSLTLSCDATGSSRAPYPLVRKMRAGICVLGPLVARRGRGIVPLPGGCQLGDRPIDLHLRCLEALGADIRIVRGSIVAKAHALRAARIDLQGPRGTTVTGTANALCAAAVAQGTSLLTRAATEPEIVDLGRFLIAAGARIDGLGTSRIEVEGVRGLHGVAWRLIPDRIEVGTLLLAGCITRGVVTVGGVNPQHLKSVLELLAVIGIRLRVEADQITIDARGDRNAVDVIGSPFPGVPTDVLPQLTALLCTASGTSQVRDAVFPERFGHVPELARLGARIRRNADTIAIEGVSQLAGAPVQAPDLRAGAALVLAGLAAKGGTTIHGLEHLDRGYEQLEIKLRELGARITRVPAMRRCETCSLSTTL